MRVSRRHATRMSDHPADHRKARLVPQPVTFGIRSRDLWRRAGRSERRGLRCIRGIAHGAGGALGRRWTGRQHFEDRKLFGISRRCKRYGARRAGSRSGSPVRRGNPAGPCRRARGFLDGQRYRLSRRRYADHRTHLGVRDRCRVPAARIARRSALRRRGCVLRRGCERGVADPRRRRVHRGRRQFSGAGRDAFFPVLQSRHDGGTRRVAEKHTLAVPDRPYFIRVEHRGADLHDRYRIARRRRATRDHADRPPQRRSATPEDELALRLHWRPAADRLGQRGGRGSR